MKKKMLWGAVGFVAIGSGLLCGPGLARATKPCDIDDLAGEWRGVAVGSPFYGYTGTLYVQADGTGTLTVHNAGLPNDSTAPAAGDNATCTFEVAPGGAGTAACTHQSGFVTNFGLIITEWRREIQFWSF